MHGRLFFKYLSPQSALFLKDNKQLNIQLNSFLINSEKMFYTQALPISQKGTSIFDNHVRSLSDYHELIISNERYL